MNKAPIPSASVIMLRESPAGLEALLLKKNANISFGGSWVFPGGRVDPQDSHTQKGLSFATERITACRECQEETGMVIDSLKLLPISWWTTPATRPKRFKTLFFLYDASDMNQAPMIDHGEIVDSQWLSISEAISQHNVKSIKLAGPAFVTLKQLLRHQSIESAFTYFKNDGLNEYLPKVQSSDQGPICLYQGDTAYHLLNHHAVSDDPALLKKIQQSPIRHRLYMRNERPWHYVNDT